MTISIRKMRLPITANSPAEFDKKRVELVSKGLLKDDSSTVEVFYISFKNWSGISVIQVLQNGDLYHEHNMTSFYSEASYQDVQEAFKILQSEYGVCPTFDICEVLGVYGKLEKLLAESFSREIEKINKEIEKIKKGRRL